MTLLRRRAPDAPATALDRRLGVATLLLAGLVTLGCLYSAWLSRGILDGESASVMSASVAWATTGTLRYTLYAYIHDLFGFSQMVVHPPLHHVLEGLVIRGFGTGPLQYTGASVAVTLAALLAMTIAAARMYGAAAAGVALLLVAALRVFYDPATGGRGDILLGACYLATVLTAIGAACGATPARRGVAAFAAGAFAVAGFAAHYYGAMAAGLAPVVAIAMIARHGAAALAGIGLALAGAGVAGGAWYGLYGEELLRIPAYVSLVSEVFAQRLHIPFSAFLDGVTRHPGGMPLLVGLALFALHLLAALARSALRGRTVPAAAPCTRELLLAAAAAWPFCFIALFTHNHNYRYWIDFLFVAAIAGAAGYRHAAGLVARLPGCTRLATPLLAATAATIGLTSPVIADWMPPPAIAPRQADAPYREVRAALLSFMPVPGTVVLGSQTFQFLPDRPHVSSMDVVLATLFGGPPQAESFAQAGERYVATMRDYPKTLPTPDQLQATALREATYIVAGEECHFWSCLFYGPAANEPGFRRVGSVVLFRTNVTGGPNPTLRALPRALTVFMRGGDALAAATALPTAARLARGAHTGVITYGPAATSGPDKARWQALDAAARADAFAGFVAANGWTTAADPSRYAPLVTAIDAAFRRRGVESLASAFEVALIDEALWTLLDGAAPP